MYSLLINPISLILTLATSFGVLIHDTQIDKATASAIAVPVIIATYGASDIALKLNDPHTHAERISISSGQPRIQVRSSEDKKYLVQKKFSASSYGSDYSWPSV